MHERRTYYDVSEANALVPRLEFLFAELARLQSQVNALHARAEKMGIDVSLDIDEFKSSSDPQERQLYARVAALAKEYSARLREVRALGVVVGDLEQGIVNFYSWTDGGEVFLSWQYGEPDVGYWHTVKEDACARRPIKRPSRSDLDARTLH